MESLVIEHNVKGVWTMKIVGLVFGTRPEVIKLTPIIRKLANESAIELVVINSGQHGEMLDRTMKVLGIEADVKATLMTEGQDLATLMSKGISTANEVLKSVLPDVVLVHGDTSTAASFAIAALTRKIKVHHVEAGLRTYNLSSPFPEEFNRQLIARVAVANYAPTKVARGNLLSEGICQKSIYVTGNTSVDSIAWVAGELKSNSGFRDSALAELRELGQSEIISSGSQFGLITLHRRENAGENFSEILSAVRMAATLRPNFQFVFPLHPNPIISKPAREMFSSVPNVHLCRPINFAAFSMLLTACSFIISDSGGIQEEAVSLGKPTLLARESTERPEGLETGLVMMPLLDQRSLSKTILDRIDGHQEGETLNLKSNPFGDGRASSRIVQHIVSDSMEDEFNYVD